MTEDHDEHMRGNLAQLTTPHVLLGLMCHTLNGEAGAAKRAAGAFLTSGNERDGAARLSHDRRSQARLLVAGAGTVAAFIWPLDSRKKVLRDAFPRRGQDIQLLLRFEENELSSLRDIRNSLMHIDERIEELFHQDSLHLWSVWKVTTDPIRGGNFMSWNPETEVLSFLESEVCIPALIETLTLIEARSMAALRFLHRIFEESLEDGDPQAERGAPALASADAAGRK